MIKYKKYAFSHGQLTQAGGVSRKGGKWTKTTKRKSKTEKRLNAEASSKARSLEGLKDCELERLPPPAWLP